MDVTIRRARVSELKIIQDLNHGLFASDGPRDPYLNHQWPYEDGQSYFKKRLVDPRSICLVAEFKGRILGYLTGSVRKTDSWRPVTRTELENMFVEDKFRSQGVGAALVKEFIKWSREKGVRRALVVAYAANDRAIRFYQKMGFTPLALSLETNLS